MAREIKSLVGFTILKANRSINLEDEEHEASIPAGSLFGIKQQQSKFFILDIDIKPLGLHLFEVSKTDYVKFANSATLVTSNLLNLIGNTNLGKLYKKRTPVDAKDLQILNSMSSALYSVAQNIPAVVYKLVRTNLNPATMIANIAEFKVSYLHTDTKALSTYSEALGEYLESRYRIVAVKPKILKRDAQVLAVTGIGVIKAVPTPDRFNELAPGIYSNKKFPDRDSIVKYQASRMNAAMYDAVVDVLDRAGLGKSAKFNLVNPTSSIAKGRLVFKVKAHINDFLKQLVEYDIQASVNGDSLSLRNSTWQGNMSLVLPQFPEAALYEATSKTNLGTSMYTDYIKPDVKFVSYKNNILTLDGSEYTSEDIKLGKFAKYSEYLIEDGLWQNVTTQVTGISGSFGSEDYSDDRIVFVEVQFINVGKSAGEVSPYTFVKPILNRMRELFNGYNARLDVETVNTKPKTYHLSLITGYSDEYKFDEGMPLMNAVLQVSSEFKDYLGLGSHSFIEVTTAVRYAEDSEVATFYTGNSYE